MTRYSPLPHFDIDLVSPSVGKPIQQITISKETKKDGSMTRIKETLYTDGTKSVEKRPIIGEPSKTRKSSWRSEKFDFKKAKNGQIDSIERIPTTFHAPPVSTILPLYNVYAKKTATRQSRCAGRLCRMTCIIATLILMALFMVQVILFMLMRRNDGTIGGRGDNLLKFWFGLQEQS